MRVVADIYPPVIQENCNNNQRHLIYIKHYTMYNKFFLYKKRTKDRDIQT